MGGALLSIAGGLLVELTGIISRRLTKPSTSLAEFSTFGGDLLLAASHVAEETPEETSERLARHNHNVSLFRVAPPGAKEKMEGR